jgi:hypothetical protein
MDLDTLLASPPVLHENDSGSLVNWGASSRLLKYLDRSLTEDSVTLETGAGLSTIVFALNRCHHTVIVPDPNLAERIQQWCRENKVSTDRLNFVIDTSQRVLPDLELPSDLDVCLIDGAHGFPLPFLDWFYMSQYLKSGGLVIVDDVQIWTGRVLFDFLSSEPDWNIEHAERLEFFGARRAGPPTYSEWTDQPYVLKKSYTNISTSRGRRAVGNAFSYSRVGRSALAIARRGDWEELRRRVAEFRRG